LEDAGSFRTAIRHRNLIAANSGFLTDTRAMLGTPGAGLLPTDFLPLLLKTLILVLYQIRRALEGPL
jgi:hypothetical protein